MSGKARNETPQYRRVRNACRGVGPKAGWRQAQLAMRMIENPAAPLVELNRPGRAAIVYQRGDLLGPRKVRDA